jgi:hypothetical protein
VPRSSARTLHRAAGTDGESASSIWIIKERAGPAMSHKHDESHSVIRNLKQRWDEEDAARDELEQQRKQVFVEEQANQIFAPIEDYFMKLEKVLQRVRASVKIEANREHLADQRLRRVVTLTSTEPWQQLSLDFTIDGASILYRDRPYRFSRGIETLIHVITSEVEEFLKPG